MAGPTARGRRTILNLFHDVFLRFDQRWLIGDNARGDEIELRDALRLWGRERERGRPEDLTAELIEALEWNDDDDEEDE